MRKVGRWVTLFINTFINENTHDLLITRESELASKVIISEMLFKVFINKCLNFYIKKYESIKLVFEHIFSAR